jgi:hypothetical protein
MSGILEMKDGFLRIPCDHCGGSPVMDDEIGPRGWRYTTFLCEACYERMSSHRLMMEEASRQMKRYRWSDGPDQGKAWVLAVFYDGKLDNLSPQAIRAKGKDWWLAVDGIGKVTLARIGQLAGGWE